MNRELIFEFAKLGVKVSMMVVFALFMFQLGSYNVHETEKFIVNYCDNNRYAVLNYSVTPYSVALWDESQFYNTKNMNFSVPVK